MLRKKIACLGVALSLSTGLAYAESMTLKLAHQWPQNEKDYVVAAGVQFAEEVEKRSGGDIKIRFFPAQSIVKAADTHTALKSGAIDLAIYPYIYSAGAIPEMNLVLLPGLWKSHNEVFDFKSTEAWKELEAKANDYGFKTLAWIQIAGGFASTDGPIRVPADLQNKKVRAAGKYMEGALVKAGASTSTMPSSETYGAMQSGLLDGLLTSSSSLGAYRVYEVSEHYVSPEDYSVYFTIEPIAISMKTWKELSPEQQKILAEAGKSVEAKALEGAMAEDKRVAHEFAANGVAVEKLTEGDWDKWHDLFATHAFAAFKEGVPGGAALLEKAISGQH
ncbi:TRAP transporter substrate-binding protein DctP [Stutzerimonas sp. VN223-3]|uniref:TRAP transporter substrate-binding protein DctP n=1 Tax=Stutzerimonas sp. VN223-3 TaxID=3384601 RepID=UPI0038B4DA18